MPTKIDAGGHGPGDESERASDSRDTRQGNYDPANSLPKENVEGHALGDQVPTIGQAHAAVTQRAWRLTRRQTGERAGVDLLRRWRSSPKTHTLRIRCRRRGVATKGPLLSPANTIQDQ